jgi:hypothetical protein
MTANEEKTMNKAAIVSFAVSALLLLSLGAQAAPVAKVHVQGSAASASFYSFNAATCAGTNGFIGAFESRQQSTGGPVLGASAFVDLYVYDECNFTLLLSAHAFVDLAPGDLEVQNSGQSASFQKSLVLEDYVTNTSIPVTVEVDWAGVGEPTRTSFHDVFRSPDGSFSSHSRGVVREAQATGSFTTGTAYGLSQAASSFATIRLSSNGSVTHN